MPSKEVFDQNDYDKVRVIRPVDTTQKYLEFLSTTDEKQVIALEVQSLLMDGSILDIGAGNGIIPDILQVDPREYTAIEQNPEFVTVLRQKGYSVIEKLFPFETDIEKVYANVLLSYVLYGAEQAKVMIPPAWELVDSGGQMIVVTYRDNVDDYTSLLHRIGHTRRVTTDTRFNFLKETFCSLGETKIKSARSHIVGHTLDQVAESISFMATNTPVGTVELREALRNRINDESAYMSERYLDEDGLFRFPIDHYFFTVKRTNKS